jgi:hypothetical protein
MGINCEICDKDCENYVLFSELYNMCLCTVLYERLALDDEKARSMYYFINGAYCRECYEETIPPLPKCPLCRKEVTKKCSGY